MGEVTRGVGGGEREDGASFGVRGQYVVSGVNVCVYWCTGGGGEGGGG